MMKGVCCLRVLWLVLCLCASCQSDSVADGRTGSSSSVPETLHGRWKRQDSAGDTRKPSGEGPAAQENDPGSGLTRLNHLQSSSSSGQYSANCCHSVPGLCSSAGKCVLRTTDCVSFCICVRSPDLPWCDGELRRLRGALRQRVGQNGGADGGDAAGGAEAGDSDASTASLIGSDLQPAMAGSQFPLSGLSLNGTVSGSLGSSTAEGEEAGSLEDHALSPAHLASSLTAAFGDGVLSGHNNDVTGRTSPGGVTGRPGPALMAMTNGEGEEPTPRQDVNASSSSGNNRTTGILLKDIIHNRDTERERNTPFLHSSSNKTKPNTTTITTTTTITRTKGSTIRPAAHGGGQFLLTLWPTENGTGCGIECELTGGICTPDVNGTSSVCVHDKEPCQVMQCEHGTCVPPTNTSVRCECEPGWGGIFCNKKCALDCGDHGRCVVFHDDVICSCDANYTGVACEQFKPPPPPWTEGVTQDGVIRGWQIAAGCLGVTALLLLLLLLSAYVLWRRQWLPMRKLVHYFQQYEEDDGKEYDAFVSYRSRSSDELFVLHELYPHLERHLDFKLCMHFRDFPPGETIADNIIQAIENSRRTILVLSPAYVQSEWCRLEYQKAQHEMLKLRHKIIPIVIEDVSGITPADRNLQTILDTVTYIQWPGSGDSKRLDKFWKLLHLSMPKKKSAEFTRSLSSAESCGSDRPLTAVSSSCFSHVVSSLSSGEQSGVALQPQRSLSITSSLEEAAEEGEAAHNADTAAATGTCCSAADSDHSSDSGCLRDRIPSSSTSSGESPPPPSPPLVIDSLVRSPPQRQATHVTSDDHIVEIRQYPGNQVKVTPWVPARLSTRC